MIRLSQQLDASWGQSNSGNADVDGSSPDNAGMQQHHQMLQVQQAIEEGITKVNLWLKTPQERTTSSNLMDLGWVAARDWDQFQSTPSLVDVAGWEATLKACGVGVAKRQGYSRMPHLVTGGE